MGYQEYIKLGFTRTEMNCNLEFSRTGYRGFALEKSLSNNIMVCATSGELDKPKLYIKKRGSETFHIIPISPEAVYDLFSKRDKSVSIASAC